MNANERRVAESEARVTEKKRAFDAADRAYHKALCEQPACVDYREAGADALLAARELSHAVGVYLMAQSNQSKEEAV